MLIEAFRPAAVGLGRRIWAASGPHLDRQAGFMLKSLVIKDIEGLIRQFDGPVKAFEWPARSG